jgi:hypothetical protein
MDVLHNSDLAAGEGKPGGIAEGIVSPESDSRGTTSNNPESTTGNGVNTGPNQAQQGQQNNVNTAGDSSANGPNSSTSTDSEELPEAPHVDNSGRHHAGGVALLNNLESGKALIRRAFVTAYALSKDGDLVCAIGSDRSLEFYRWHGGYDAVPDKVWHGRLKLKRLARYDSEPEPQEIIEIRILNSAEKTEIPQKKIREIRGEKIREFLFTRY